jgi:MFS family permease
MTPDHLRGRVMAVYSMMFMGMAPIGALLSGVLADRFGAPFTVAMGGVIAIAGSFAFGLRLPALRPEARRLITAQHMVAGDPADEVTAHGGGDPD